MISGAYFSPVFLLSYLCVLRFEKLGGIDVSFNLPEGWEAVIGLEIHIQVKTSTKAFCSCSSDYFGKEPNTNVCPICLGHPGTLPVPNVEHLRKAIAFARAVGCSIRRTVKFDRKNYFYPDLPKGYQITQYDEPIGYEGEIKLVSGKKIRVKRVHMEEDTGKIVYAGGDRMADSDAALIDYNRAGIPLIEVVSEADMRTPEEAVWYARQIQYTARVLGVSDADMEKGSMRVDVNVSVRKVGESGFRTKTEIKNLNSFRSLREALEYEIKRQIDVWESKERVENVTMLWDEKKRVTRPMRGKEGEADYRYFPEPDILRLDVPEEIMRSVGEILSNFKSPFEVWNEFSKIGLAEKERIFLIENPEVVEFIHQVYEEFGDGFEKNRKKIVSAVLNYAVPKGFVAESTHLACSFAAALKLWFSKKVEKEGFSKLLDLLKKEKGEVDVDRAEKIATEKGLIISSDVDEGELIKEIEKIVNSFPDKLEAYKSGKKQLFGFFMGQVMQKFRGKVPGSEVQKLLRQVLDGR